MPEIKSTFTQGKMNKDLDERIVPKGQYRDAMNIQVSTSEGSDVGTVQNISGNVLIGQNTVGGTWECVGSIADEKNDALYSFIASSGGNNAIIKYTKDGTAIPVIVDAGSSILNFSQGDMITGINIIDNLLLWTDGISEPKKINIDDCILGSTDLVTNTVLYVDGVTTGKDIKEEDITVIKKNPLRPLTVKINEAATDVKAPLFEKIFPRFSYRYRYVDGEYSTYAPFTDVIFNSKYVDTEDVSGSVVFYDDKTSYDTLEPYNAAMRNWIESIELYDFVSETMPSGVVQIDILYKQENSPTIYILEVIKNYEPGNIYQDWDYKLHPASSYSGKFTVRSENVYAALPESQTLRSWDNVPKTALAQEVTGNRVVYGNYTQSHNLVDASNNQVIPKTNVLVRSRYDVPDFSDGGLKSLKAQRNYQLGVVYGDEYGRETPVFTNSNASIVLPWKDVSGSLNGEKSTQLTTYLSNNHPEWASYYKFFVKETSGEYYNLVMSALYNPTVEDVDKEQHSWISFASSDRNKISKDDYIIFKKITEQSYQTYKENKYRVLDVQNEAPDAIKFKYVKYGSVVGVVTSAGNNSHNDDLFLTSGKRPASQTKSLYINKANWLERGGTELTSDSFQDQDLYFSFFKGDANNDPQRSSKYKIVKVSLRDISNKPTYDVLLSKPISAEDDTLCSSVSSANAMTVDITVEVEKKIHKGLELFSGKFFVKILKDNLIKEELEALDPSQMTYATVALSTINPFYHSDVNNVGSNDISTGLVNNNGSGQQNYTNDPNSLHSGGDLTDTKHEWETLLSNMGTDKWFIDGMHMVATQTSSDNYARHATQGWYGGNHTVPGDIINNTAPINGWKFWGTGINPDNANVFHGFSYPAISDTTYPLVHKIIQPQDPGVTGENQINGLEGVVTTNATHVDPNGLRRWENIVWNTSGFNSIRSQDLTYKNNNGRFFLHLSFLAPGENLHNGYFNGGDSNLHIYDNASPNTINPIQGQGANWSLPIDDTSINNLWNNLQAIYGGGVFQSTSMANPFVLDPFEDPSPTNNWGDSGAWGNEAGIIPLEMGGPVGGLQGAKRGVNSGNANQGFGAVGYNPGTSNQNNDINNFEEKHLKQWDLVYGNSSGSDQTFASQLIQGAKIKFTGDTELYVIKNNPEIKKVYNHTPWRTMYKSNGNSGLTAMGNSVEEAVIAWADSTTNGTNGHAGKTTFLKQKLQDFGNKNNRRLVYIIELDKDPALSSSFNPVDGTNIDSTNAAGIEIVVTDPHLAAGEVSEVPAIWETEPKDSVDLDIYYEASQAYPTSLTIETVEMLAPIGSNISINVTGAIDVNTEVSLQLWDAWNSDFAGYEASIPGDLVATLDIALNEIVNAVSLDYTGATVRFNQADGGFTEAVVSGVWYDGASSNIIYLVFNSDSADFKDHGLGWYNCFSFGNGIESNRIRDDFNAMTLTNGVRANITSNRPYTEEHRKNGLIYSGLYNSTSGVNNLNQFLMAEKITKDLNPTFGSIQKLFSRRISLIAFCEDRVIGITANKNALYNADGNPQLVSSNSVLGDANPFVGDYGISKNPESFAKDSYRAYFTDKQRGAVLRLSMDGITPVSEAGMSNWFKDELKKPQYNIIGSFDTYKGDYNLTLDGGTGTMSDSHTISYSEDVKGWVSFKSFTQESGVSMSGDYYTFKEGKCWKHDNGTRNTFYNTPTPSSIKFVFNDSPTSIKNFNTLNYDGDNNWTCNSVVTDQQSGTVNNFIEKEGKWFNYISGSETADVKAFNFQGIGIAEEITTI